MPEAYIVAAARTAGGRRGGALRDWHPADMAAEVLDSLIERSGLDPAAVEDVIMGCVGQAGEQSATPGRQAWLAAGFPTSVPSVTIERKCGSGQQALEFAAQSIVAGANDIVIAAGIESEDTLTWRTAVGTAQALGQGITVFPSDHGGFLGGEYGMTGEPDAFAAALRQVLAVAGDPVPARG